ncbi:ATP-dependent helicase [Paraclostridium bifermentans]|uniref:ATP-dependent helicase n=1 Tax=Paraclostridium bifermentans TaxID=1490 RepID=UPI00359C7E2E
MSKINYREDQIPIINYEEGTMAVPAVPGAGKTFIVTNLVAKLIKNGNNKPGKILILTYMNSAVNNFKGRIAKLLEENEVKETNSYEVMTIHSLAVKIIKEKPEIVMLNDEFSIVDDLKRSIILNECIDKFKNNGGEKAFKFFVKEQRDEEWRNRCLEAWNQGFFDLVVNSISELKYKDISPQKLEDIILNGHKGILKCILPIYKDYEKKLKNNGLLDYDDILILAYKALSSDEDLKTKFQNRYTYIFEDECQDSNELQGNIIKLISENNNNLVRVGDVNQSINGTFSSSDPIFFKNFMEEADNCYKMDMSNRSSKDIIDLANELVNFITNDFYLDDCKSALEKMEIRTVPEGKGYKENPKSDKYLLNAKWYETWEKEIRQTVKFVDYIKKTTPDKSIGLLVPFNNQVREVAEVLEEYNLEFDELGPNSSHKRKVINNIGYVVEFLSQCDDVDKLVNVLEKIYIQSDNKIGKEEFIAKLRRYDSEDIIYDTDKVIEDIVIDNRDDIYITFIDGIKSIKSILEYQSIKTDELILLIGENTQLSNEEKAMVDYIAFYVKHLMLDNPNTSLYDIGKILLDDRNRVFNYISEIIYEINGYEPKPGGITVCTYHKSKGMEWDVVFLLDLTEFKFPADINQKFQGELWYLKDKYKNPVAMAKAEVEALINGDKPIDFMYKHKVDIINEKIRLLYVGVTRAKEMLMLSGYSYKDNTTNKKQQQKPSFYFNKLGRFIKEKRGEIVE